jgi:hypothetical protein
MGLLAQAPVRNLVAPAMKKGVSSAKRFNHLYEALLQENVPR